MNRIAAFCSLLFVLVVPPSSHAQAKTLKAVDAKDHVGELATVCGHVDSARYAAQSKGQPTFLNLDGAYPKELFTILIWGENRAKFGTPDSKYLSSNICVTGKITIYRATPEIVASDAGQIVLQPILSNDNHYTNSDGTRVHSPAYSDSVPPGATAQCNDGTYSFSQHRQGTCSHHGGVARWL
jgi:hypothetical protein